MLALQGSRKRVVTAPAEGAASDTALDVAGPATGRAGAAKSSSTKRAAAAAATAIAAATSVAAAGCKKPKRSFLQEIKSIPKLCRNRFIRKIPPEIIDGAYSELKGKGKVQSEPKNMTGMRALVAKLMGYEVVEVPLRLLKHPPTAAAATAARCCGSARPLCRARGPVCSGEGNNNSPLPRGAGQAISPTSATTAGF